MSMRNPTDLSIIIINWKSVDFLRSCLGSIYAGKGNQRHEIIVVDNASFDGSAAMVRDEFPGVIFIQSEKNLGFAGANNFGFASSNGRYLLFLNPDTEIIGTAISDMTSVFQSTADAGIVGCKLLNSDRSVQMSCVQPFPSILNQALDAEYLRERFPQLPLWGTDPAVTDADRVAEAEVISGACLMIRRDVFEMLGGFSRDYFMYSDDVDLCYRARKVGWKAYYVGSAEVIHHGGKSSGSASQDNFAAILMRESLLKFLTFSRGRFYAFGFRMTTALAALVRLGVLGGVWVAGLGRPRRESLSASRAKWAKVFRWAIGLEGWAKSLS
jgi:N-acetylglucosaminyl-diphospho-decaprenol L-rhamnosyltransferase